jgi:hypothetical protein
LIHVANNFVVVLDTNVLYPFRKRDILLQFAHAGFFRACWTDRIEAEWTGRLLARKPHLAASVEANWPPCGSIFPRLSLPATSPDG